MRCAYLEDTRQGEEGQTMAKFLTVFLNLALEFPDDPYPLFTLLLAERPIAVLVFRALVTELIVNSFQVLF
jgi:hypothetical protein